MARKRTFRKVDLTNSQVWRIELLADWGFAYKLIAKKVLKDTSDTSVRVIGRVLRNASIRVRDFREGKNNVSKSVLKDCMRRSK